MYIISFMLLLIVSIKLITFGWKLKLVYNSTLLWTENKLPELLTIDASHQISNLSEMRSLSMRKYITNLKSSVLGWELTQPCIANRPHYIDVITGTMASQITSLTIVYSSVYSDADQRKHQSSASLVFVRGIHRWSVNSPHNRPVTRKMVPFDDVIVIKNWVYLMEYITPCLWHYMIYLLKSTGCWNVSVAYLLNSVSLPPIERLPLRVNEDYWTQCGWRVSVQNPSRKKNHDISLIAVVPSGEWVTLRPH